MKILKSLLLILFIYSFGYAGQIPYNIPGMLLLMHFNEGAGAYTYSVSGSTIIGTLKGGAHIAGWTSNGKYGKAITFDGVADWVDGGSDPSLFVSSVVSIGVWVNFTSTVPTNAYAFILTLGSWDCNLFIGDGTGRIQVNMTGVGGLNSPAGTDVLPNRWYYIVATYDKYGLGDKLKLYMNGVLVASAASTGGNITAADGYALRLGSNGGGRWLNGTIDEVSIFNTAIPAAQVMFYYRSKARILKIFP